MEKVSESIGKSLEYFCENCDYKTGVKSNYTKHCLTAKHMKSNKCNKCNEKVSESIDNFPCMNCGKVYKSNVGIWRHLKVCSETLPVKKEKSTIIMEMTASEKPINNNINTLSNSAILDILKENQEFKELLVEQQKENKELMNKMIEITQNQLSVPTTINNINNLVTTNNNHQKFNLNFFLNETCKDAMNIQDFIDNIRITFEDLLTIGNAGFVNGLSDIFMKQLLDLEVEKRPIHCTDAKRETIYFKENDTWEKDDTENKRIKDVIEKVEYKNVAALHQWCEENPDAKINNTPNNLLRDKIFLQTLQGDDRNRDKIIKNIAKEVVVSRDNNILLE